MKANQFTSKKRRIFLETLANVGNVTLAAKEAGISRVTLYARRKQEERFALAWDDAEKQAADVLEAEARRRACVGVLEPVHYQGQRVDEVRRYSDTLLIFLMKGCNPAKYGDRVKVGVGGLADGEPLTIKHVAVFEGDEDLDTGEHGQGNTAT
jgi:transposase-like protein